MNTDEHRWKRRKRKGVIEGRWRTLLCESERSAKYAFEVATTTYLEKTLKLIVNQEKPHLTHCSKGVKFSGVKIYCNFTIIQEKNLITFKEKVKALTKKNQGMNLEMVIRRLNPLLRGFANYFGIANCKSVFQKLMQWIRRRLRAIQLKLWKKPDKLQRRLRQLGYTGYFPKIKMISRHNSNSIQTSLAMPNKWFNELNLFNMELVVTGLIVPV